MTKKNDETEKGFFDQSPEQIALTIQKHIVSLRKEFYTTPTEVLEDEKPYYLSTVLFNFVNRISYVYDDLVEEKHPHAAYFKHFYKQLLKMLDHHREMWG